jgi:hypothetical protein
MDWFLSWVRKEEIGAQKLGLAREIFVRIGMLQPIVLRSMG